MICKDCGKEFNITPGEIAFYETHKLSVSKRCTDCRKSRKVAQKEIEQNKKWEEDERRLNTLLLSLPFHQIQLSDLQFPNPDKSLVIIGNGFDIMHGAKS